MSERETITIDRAVLLAAFQAVWEARRVLDTPDSPLGHAADEARRALRRAYVALESPYVHRLEREFRTPPVIQERDIERAMFQMWRDEHAHDIARAEFDHLDVGARSAA